MIHTKELSEANFKAISKELKGYEDSSYRHDITDSIYNEAKDIAIYFPNSNEEDTDREKFNTFSVALNSEEVNGTLHYSDDVTTLKTVEEVIKYIKGIK